MTRPRDAAPPRRRSQRAGGRAAERRPAASPRRRPRPRRELHLGDPRRRLRAGLLLVGFVLSLFAGRLLQIQGIDASAYATVAAAKRLETVVLPATRGSITDRTGAPLATTVQSHIVTADLELLASPAAAAYRLAPVLGLEPDPLRRVLTGKKRYVRIARNVSPAAWAQVQALAIPGIRSEPEPRRVYPGGEIGASVLGFVHRDGKGGAGIEQQLDRVLAGKNGQRTFERDPEGRPIPTGTNAETEPQAGRDVTLTIDRDIQYVAQQEVAKAVKATKAESGTAVVLDPRTGELLALATAPTFDPNRVSEAPEELRGNRALTEEYEPGSTGKVLTAAAVIEEGAATPDTVLTVPNRLERGGKSFKDFNEHDTLRLTYAGTLAKSSNIGTILAAERLDLPKLVPYLERFGIGSPTGLGFPGENPGALLPPDEWTAPTGYTMTFGQSYSVNTVQMASAIGAIANAGVRVAPTLVRAVEGEEGTVVRTPEPARTRVVSARTARTVARMMEGVTGEGGTAPKTALPGYRTAGKTGTAQRFDPECSCYSGYTMSYIGFAPADDPALVVAVTLQKPRSGAGGGATAGPVFTRVMTYALQRLQVPPTGSRPPTLRLEAD